jgi:hypothetical protein
VAAVRPAVLRLPNHHSLSIDEIMPSSGESSWAPVVGPGVDAASPSATAAAARMVAVNEGTTPTCSASKLGRTEPPANVREAAASSHVVDGEGEIAGWRLDGSSGSPVFARLGCGSGLPAHSSALICQRASFPSVHPCRTSYSH